MGLSGSNLSAILKPFECLTHCKVTTKSPCCKHSCGEEPCSCSIDTHENNDHELVEI